MVEHERLLSLYLLPFWLRFIAFLMKVSSAVNCRNRAVNPELIRTGKVAYKCGCEGSWNDQHNFQGGISYGQFGITDQSLRWRWRCWINTSIPLDLPDIPQSEPCTCVAGKLHEMLINQLDIETMKSHLFPLIRKESDWRRWTKRSLGLAAWWPGHGLGYSIGIGYTDNCVQLQPQLQPQLLVSRCTETRTAESNRIANERCATS